MKIYGTWHAFLVEQLAEEEDVGGFFTAVMEEYQIHGNLAIIQLALQYVVEAKGGISEIAEKIHVEPQVLSAVLDDTKTPNIDTLRTVLNAFGCYLPIRCLETVDTRIVATTEESAVAPEAVASKYNLD